MAKSFKRVALMGRSNTEGVAATLNALLEHLSTLNIETVLEQETASLLPRHDLPILARDNLSGNCDLLIVVGGDGSLLGASRAAADQDLPVVGVNRGNLGFLTDIRPDELENVDKILRGDYVEEKRFLLCAEISDENRKSLAKKIALNDVVLLPSEINRMIEFSVYINGKFVCAYKADGIIVATPTGSTAHALSGGGPILHPALNALALVPMFSHTLSSRPIVINADSEINIVMAGYCKAAPNISCDGQELISIPECGAIKITKHRKQLRLIHLADYDYYATLRSKLNWESA